MLSSIKHYLGNGVQEIRFAFSQNANNSNSLRYVDYFIYMFFRYAI